MTVTLKTRELGTVELKVLDVLGRYFWLKTKSTKRQIKGVFCYE